MSECMLTHVVRMHGIQADATPIVINSFCFQKVFNLTLMMDHYTVHYNTKVGIQSVVKSHSQPHPHLVWYQNCMQGGQ